MSGTWDSGWITGDIVTAAEFKKGVGATRDVILGADTANFDVTSIPAGYAHLSYKLYVRTSEAAANSQVFMRLNNDSGSNYSAEFITANGTTVAASESIAGSGSFSRCPANNAPANSFGSVTCEIPYYAGTTNHKHATGLASSREGTTTGTMVLVTSSFVWFATAAAINRITLLPGGGGNFKSGSRLTLYVWGA